MFKKFVWNPTQPTATRPLAIQKDGNWFTYGYDITKNVCELFGPAGYIRTSYSYAPFGAVSESGDVSQPFQWSSEHYDSELDLVYYNYRHYSPTLGRFLSRDPIEEQGGRNLYAFVKNNPIRHADKRGAISYREDEFAISNFEFLSFSEDNFCDIKDVDFLYADTSVIPSVFREKLNMDDAIKIPSYGIPTVGCPKEARISWGVYFFFEIGFKWNKYTPWDSPMYGSPDVPLYPPLPSDSD